MRTATTLLILALSSACSATAEPRADDGGPTREAPPAPTGALFPIEDVFVIAGRGTVVTGKVARGTIKVGDTLELTHAGARREVRVSGLEKFRALVDSAGPGDVVGVLLRGVGRDDLTRGDVLATPGAVTARVAFTATIRLLPIGEGGRATPIAPGYRPLVQAWTASVSAIVALPADRDALAPGESAEVTLTAEAPIVVEVGMEITLREGGRTVGSGTVTGWAR